MKKIFTLPLALSFAAALSAQDISMTQPEFLDQFSSANVCATGINNDGSIIYGASLAGQAAFYDFNRADSPFFLLESGPEDNLKLGLTVAGFDQQGMPLVCDYLNSYFYNTNTGMKTFLESPDPAYGVNAWDITDDATLIGCNLTNVNFSVIPMVGRLQEDGTYKLEYLPTDPEDAMGCQAQYSQVRAVSNDGSYIFGVQPDFRGMGGRLVVWVRQDDGSYEFTTPIDEFLYDYSVEKPGASPEWEDYVTADPDADPELWDSQANAFDTAYEEYENRYMEFTRGYSFLDVFGVHKATNSDVMCMALKDNRTPEKGGMLTPVFYDCATGEVTDFPEVSGDAFGFDALPGGGYIYAKKSAELCSLVAVEKDGTSKPFGKWLEEVTGTDISEDYTYTFYDYIDGTETTDAFFGRPYFSGDGKSLMFSGMNPDNGDFLASVVRFDRNIFESVTTGIKVNITDRVVVSGSTIKLDGAAKASVYAMDGSLQAEYAVDGNVDLGGMLAPGTYIVKVSQDGRKPISVKMVVRK